LVENLENLMVDLLGGGIFILEILQSVLECGILADRALLLVLQSYPCLGLQLSYLVLIVLVVFGKGELGDCLQILLPRLLIFQLI